MNGQMTVVEAARIRRAFLRRDRVEFERALVAVFAPAPPKCATRKHEHELTHRR